MIPEVGLLGVTEYEWIMFRATMDKVLKLRPDLDINALPIELSNDTKVLLNIAAYYGWSIGNPLHVIRNLPSQFMDFLSYQFFIACKLSTWEEFNSSSGIRVIKKDVPELDNSVLLIASGTLSAWHESIIDNLGRDWKFSSETRALYCKIMLILERDRGLKLLFDDYRKKVQPDQTFLLEKK